MNTAFPPPPIPPMPPRTVLVIGSLAWSLVNFRLDLMRRMRDHGHRVLAAASDFDPATETALRAEGLEPLSLPIDRTGTNPWRDINTLQALRRLIRDRRPDVILPYTMKPIVYGCLAARLEGNLPCYPLFTGLGYAFCDPSPTGKRRIVRGVSIALHRIATRHARLAFYYNIAEARDLRRFRLVPDATRLVAVPGSGVDVDRFHPTPMPDAPMAFLFVGRMLHSKGVGDLVAASRLLRAEGHRFRVDLVGPLDSNPDAVSHATLQSWLDDAGIVHHGATRDVLPYLHASHVMVLPTRLREGVPRTILEAMACGRPVITTDAPGCGETVVDGQGGLVVPVGDIAALAAAMRRFLTDPTLVARMGEQARARVVASHDVHDVNRLLLERMDLEPSAAPLPLGVRSWA